MKSKHHEFSFKVVLAEESTGIVLSLDGQNYSKEGEESAHYFDSLDQAKLFANDNSRDRPKIEYSIFDASGNLLCLFVCGREEHRASIKVNIEELNIVNPWWAFWRRF